MKIKTYNNLEIELDLPDNVDTTNLLALPALIDPHVHFRIPGGEHKEDWITAGSAAIAGGVTTVFDMPNNTPPTTNRETLEKKKAAMQKLFAQSGIHIRYKLWLGATPDNTNDIEDLRDEIVGVKIFMGASTGNLLVADYEAQKNIFKKCTELNLVAAVHAEDDEIINAQKNKFPNATVKDHGKIRPNIAAQTAVKKALDLARETGVTLYILHVSTAEEIELIRQAKKEGVRVFAEVTPHHLFLTEEAYETLGAKAQMNPPLRSKNDQIALWEAIKDGTIDTIGTDHAPHTLQEKTLPYPQSPSGVPGIETYLPLLLDAYNAGKITLEKIVELTHTNPKKIFGLKETDDWVLVDLNQVKIIKNEELKTKCGWSPFAGRELKGAPKFTILNNIIYKI